MAANMVLEKNPPYKLASFKEIEIWQQLINDLFEEFISFFATSIYEEIDFTKTPTLLSHHLWQQQMKYDYNGAMGNQIVNVHLKNNEEKWILIHIESNHQSTEAFARRMFQYFYQLFDEYNQKIYTIALLPGNHKGPEKNYYQHSFYSTVLVYSFNAYYFYNKNIKELEQSSNPFAFAVITEIIAVKFDKDFHNKALLKKQLKKKVYNRFQHHPNKSRLYIQSLFNFIDHKLKHHEN